MKAKEMRQLPDNELLAQVGKRREEIFRMRLKAGSEDVESSGKLRRMKHDIARVFTIIRERQIEKAKNNG